MIDQALAREGVPHPDLKKKKDKKEFDVNSDSSEYSADSEDTPSSQKQPQNCSGAQAHIDGEEESGGKKGKFKIQNIQFIPSNRGPKGLFCMSDNGVSVGCTGA